MHIDKPTARISLYRAQVYCNLSGAGYCEFCMWNATGSVALSIETYK